MNEFLTLLLGAALVNNPVTVSALGLSPLVVLDRRLEVAGGMAGMTLLVVPLLSLLAFLLDRAAALPAGGAEALRLPLLLPLFGGLLLLARQWLARYHPRWAARFGVYLPLFALNSLAPGCVLLSLDRAGGAGEALALGLGLAAGYAVILLLLAGLYLRVAMAAVPAPLRGAPVSLINLALLALAFAGLAPPP